MNNKSMLSAVQSVWRWFHHLLSTSIGYNDIRCDLPKSTGLPHSATGVVVGENVRFGEDCVIHSGVVIGQRDGEQDVRIGDGVEIGANAVIIGDVRIGDSAKIGAGAVVLDDVPAGATVVGVPGKVVS